MATVLACLLGVPAALVVAYRLMFPPEQAPPGRADADGSENTTEKPRRHRNPGESVEDYAARCNFTTDTDNGVQVAHDGEAA